MTFVFTQDTALSMEPVAMSDLADLLSQCQGFRYLNDQSDADAARAKIVICSERDPWEPQQGKVSISQLEDMLLEANICPIDQNDHEVFEPRSVGGAGSAPLCGGTFEMRILRQIREAEFSGDPAVGGGPNGCYLRFLDCVSSIAEELPVLARLQKPVIRAVRRAGKPKWNPFDAASSQGNHIWCILEVDWGDRGGPEE